MLRTTQKAGRGLLLAALGLAGAACETTERRSPIPEETLQVRRSERGATWALLDADGVLIGHLARFAEGTADEHFVVSDPWQQDLGMIDIRGRAYRYLPHHIEPAWVGTGTVREGAARILGRAEVTLVENAPPPGDDEAGPQEDGTTGPPG